MVNPLDLGIGLGIGFLSGLFTTIYAGLRTNWIQERIYRLIDVYIEDFASQMEKNPQIAARFVKPIIKSAMHEFNTAAPAESGIKVPGLGKVPISALMQLMQMFGGGAKNAAAEAAKDLLG